MVKSMKKMLRQTFSVFEPEQCQEMGYYRYSFDRNFIIFWQMKLVCFFFWYILFIVSFGCVTIANREFEKCQCCLIYDKTNGDIARLEWVCDAFNGDANFGKSVKLKQK